MCVNGGLSVSKYLLHEEWKPFWDCLLLKLVISLKQIHVKPGDHEMVYVLPVFCHSQWHFDQKKPYP